MTDLSTVISPRKMKPIRTAVYQNKAVSRARHLRAAVRAGSFPGWSTRRSGRIPDVDMEAMELAEGHRVVTIASGGCNMLAYLTRSPASIDAVDLNQAHIALNR